MAAYDFERPYIPRSRFQLYRVTEPAIAADYGERVMAAPLSNIEYKTRYERLAKANRMKAPPSCGRIFMGYLTLRHLGDEKRMYETWIPAHGFEDSHAPEVDFTAMTQRQILTFLAAHFEELGATALPDDVDEWEKGITSGYLSLDLLPSGFALAQKPALRRLDDRPKLCRKLVALYVCPAARGMGIGRDLVSRAKASCQDGVPMTLECFGDGRRAYFEHLGFTVLHPFEGSYEMIYRAG